MLLYYLTGLQFRNEIVQIHSPNNNIIMDFSQIKNETHYPINPSIIYDDPVFWGTVRVTNDHKCTKHIEKEYTNEVHYIENYNSIEVVDPGHLNWCKHITFKRKGCEDPRSFLWRNHKYALITVVGKDPYPCNNKIYLYHIKSKVWSRIFSPFSDNKKMEKNWTPLIYKDDLFIDYFVNPRKIFHYASGTIIPQTLCKKLSIYLHGSVNPVQISDTEYLGMAHTNPDYLHVWYIFEASPPFTIKRFSRYFGIDRINNTQYEFVTGMSYVSKTKEVIISYSINDCHNQLKIFNLQTIRNDIIHDC